MENRIIKLFYQTEDFFFKNISKEVAVLENNTTAYVTGVNSAGLNIVAQRDTLTNPQLSLKQAIELYSSYNLPWIWISKEELVTEELDNTFEHNGLELIDESTAMVYDLRCNQIFKIDNSLNIIESNNDLNNWTKPLLEAFESTEEAMNQYITAHSRANKKKGYFHHHVGFTGSNPVTSITLSINNNIARIDDVGTLPGFQGKGYASTMIKHVLNKAKKFKADYCFLEASKAGLSIYRKIGFKELFNNKIYSLK
ncbi:GNAT family N-acetyltransferase [Candidatus Jidaibacter acanthamoebae]|nr:GNAT family N-acetyltransferase [Candidatus Jidaibacter acanthamoeba]